MGRFDVDDEYRRNRQEQSRRSRESELFRTALAQSGLEGYSQAGHRASSTMASPPVRGSIRWTVSISSLRNLRLYSMTEVEDFLRELHDAIPWSKVSAAAHVVELARVPLLVLAPDWEAQVQAAIDARHPFMAGKARERRAAEKQLMQLVERRRRTMRSARPVRYARFYKETVSEDYTGLDWELFVTNDGLFSASSTHNQMQEKIVADMKAWKFRLE